jgi:RimJ/RimL family protein N-acetyltransferase
VTYLPFTAEQAEALVGFLTAEPWPFHADRLVDAGAARERIATGYYDNDSSKSFWIVADGNRIGFLQLEDLDDGGPMFDLRIHAAHRGGGHGTRAVRWLTEYVFTGWPTTTRIEAVTRQDNRAMRAVLRRCGFAKESHYRDAWPGADGAIHDSVGYAILRRDWSSGTITVPQWDDEVPGDTEGSGDGKM